MVARSWWEDYKVSVPEGTSGRVVIDHFEVKKLDSLENVRLSMHGMRPVPVGRWTRISEGGTLWMTDTPSEMIDHLSAIREIEERGGRVLINGLGLGMVLQAALRAPKVTHVDVVELSQDVVNLVGDHYAAMAAERGVSLDVHVADAYEARWPVSARWNVVWHDIWPDITTDNLDGMGRLHRKYGRRAAWQGSWRRECLYSQRRREVAAGW